MIDDGDFLAMGDRCKAAEGAESERKALPGAVVMARFDGRAFHTYTRGFTRPYDERMQDAMRAAAAAILEDLHPDCAYTQSDEITVAWTSGGAASFDGRFQKIASVGASLAGVAFTEAMGGRAASFDGRAWQVTTAQDALDVFLWREADATKNSVSMLAQAHFSHRELQGKKSSEMRAMLESKGVAWGEAQTHFKRGIFLRRGTVERTLSCAERESIPGKHRPAPDAVFTRGVTNVLNLPPLRKMSGDAAIAALFRTPMVAR